MEAIPNLAPGCADRELPAYHPRYRLRGVNTTDVLGAIELSCRGTLSHGPF
jgi:hypothetical protein